MRKEDLLQVANRALSAGIPLEEFVWKNRAQLPCIYYHAGKRLVPHPTASHRSTFPGDFGHGFYVTKDIAQARRFIKSKYKGDGMISMGMWFEDNLSGYVFNAVNHDWAQAIANFRSYGKYEPLASVDVIEGPIADDSVWDITRGYLFW